MSIKTKLLIFALCISLIPISLITTVYYFNTRDILKDNVLNEMMAIAESKKLHLLSFIDAKQGRVIDFSSDGLIRDSLEMMSKRREQINTVLRLNRHLIENKMSLDPHVLQIDVIDREGKIISSTRDTSIGHNVSDYEGLNQLYNGRFNDINFKEPHFSKTLNRIDIDFAAPIISKSGGTLLGCIVLHYDASAFNLITSDHAGMGETVDIYIVTRNKIMLSESRFVENTALNQVVNTEPVRSIIEYDNDEMMGIYPDYRGVQVVGASINIPNYGWVLIAEVGSAEAFASISELGVFIICLVSMSVIIVIILVIIISKKIINPIQKLVEGTERIATGDLSFKIETKSRDEIGCLGKSFNTMTTQLIASKKLIEDYALNLKIKVEDKTREIKQSKEYTESLIETAQDGFVCIDENKIINVWNKTAEEIFGYSKNEIIGKSITTILPDKYIYEFHKEIMRYSNTDKGEIIGKTMEVSGKTKEGDEVPIDLSISSQRTDEGKYSFTMIIRDITERKKLMNENASLEEQLIRTQKMEAIGTMAGGIAHDFNNILTPIMGYADLAMSRILPSDQMYDELEQVMRAAHRAKDLVEQILVFSKNIEIEKRPLDLYLIVNEALKLLRPSIPSTINISKKIDSSCDTIFADATQMHQVIVNLCTNAWQAIEPDSGELFIEVKQVEVDVATVKLHPNLNQSDYVCLSVTDTGTGIDKAILDHIFEPFFTTKDVDKGTGMGLSVTHGIVHSHDGEILVDSKPGKGTAFHVYLPVFKSKIDDKQIKPTEIQGGQEPILLVDDDAAITSMMEQMLKSLGYRVDAYSNSLDALKAFNHHPDKYDLLISDLTMPDLTGIDLSEQVQKMRSGFPVIITTGYSDDSLSNDSKSQLGIRQVIKKPLKKRDLALAIRDVFDL